VQKSIWLLAREGDWQEMVSCVVVALDEDTARQWAASEHGDEGEGAWYDPETPCARIGEADESIEFGLICRNYMYV
jgi:hypothetical protein